MTQIPSWNLDVIMAIVLILPAALKYAIATSMSRSRITQIIDAT